MVRAVWAMVMSPPPGRPACRQCEHLGCRCVPVRPALWV